MKKVLLLMVGILMVANVAMADHIGLYLDATGASCVLPAGGYFTGLQANVLQKFSLGATGLRFSLSLPAGSNVLAFSSVFTASGTLGADMTVGYGSCQTGTINVGAIIGTLTAGVAQAGPAQGFPQIIYTDCATFAEKPASGGTAYIGVTPGSCNEVATEPSTWGQVKALYR